MLVWISIYFIGVFVCGLFQLYTQHLRLVGVDRRRWHHPPPERSPYKPIEVWWMYRWFLIYPQDYAKRKSLSDLSDRLLWWRIPGSNR